MLNRRSSSRPALAPLDAGSAGGPSHPRGTESGSSILCAAARPTLGANAAAKPCNSARGDHHRRDRPGASASIVPHRRKSPPDARLLLTSDTFVFIRCCSTMPYDAEDFGRFDYDRARTMSVRDPSRPYLKLPEVVPRKGRPGPDHGTPHRSHDI